MYKNVEQVVKIIIDSSEIKMYEIPDELMRKMRSSVILAGALIGRFGKAILSYPGGCDIGTRPIDLHLKGFEALGATVKNEKNKFLIKLCSDRLVDPSGHTVSASKKSDGSIYIHCFSFDNNIFEGKLELLKE